MASTSNSSKLTCITYNCEQQKLYVECDCLLLQEHCLFNAQFDWFYKIHNDICFHGRSAMEETEIIMGKPYGGVAILWNRDIKNRVEPVDCHSNRICAVKIHPDNHEQIILFCVYMPSDDRLRGHNLTEFIDTLKVLKQVDQLASKTLNLYYTL